MNENLKAYYEVNVSEAEGLINDLVIEQNGYWNSVVDAAVNSIKTAIASKCMLEHINPNRDLAVNYGNVNSPNFPNLTPEQILLWNYIQGLLDLHFDNFADSYQRPESDGFYN